MPTDPTWKEFATRAPDRDPERTIDAREHLEAVARGGDATRPDLTARSATEAAGQPTTRVARGAKPRAAAIELEQTAAASPVSPSRSTSKAGARDGAVLPLIDFAEADGPSTHDFQVTAVLGEGGMGRVYLARQRSLDRDVAIKVVKSEISSDATLGGLLDEARITGALEHPGIVPVHALGRDGDGRPVLVMKRIEGVSWRDVALDPLAVSSRSRGAAAGHEDALADLDHADERFALFDGDDPVGVHVEIAMSACNALHFAHSRGVVHRDVKLDNVMIGRFGEVVVVDWGIAVRAPAPGERSLTVGTPSYMPPELVVGDLGRVDARTDVYLLAASLHHALVGSPRHHGENLYGVLFAASESEPFAYGPEVPAELAAILNGATSRESKDRPASALALRRAFADFRKHRGSTAMSDAAAARLAALDEAVAALEVREADGAPRLDAAADRAALALATECRFAFGEALRAWPENAAARAGLASCLTLAARHEIARRDPERAKALLAELDAPQPELDAKVERLGFEIAEERAEQARAAAVARDQDMRVGGRTQVVIVAALPVMAAGIATDVFLHRAAISSLVIVGAPAAATVFLGSAALVLRRRLRTAISRRAVASIVVLPAAATVHRLAAIALGATIPQILVGDLLIAAACLAVIGIALVRGVAWVALPSLVAVVVTAIAPATAVPCFAVSTVSSFVVLLMVWRRATA